jgi:hypothetical protein
MGTDYGFGCETCGVTDDDGRIREKRIIDNYRDVEGLVKLLAIPKLFELVQLLGEIDLSVASSTSSIYYGFDEALKFVTSHRERGHVVRVCDEYGRFVEQCFRYATCETCGHNKCCVLKEGHNGAHSAKVVATSAKETT